jgi:molecular chaperone GrpE
MAEEIRTEDVAAEEPKAAPKKKKKADIAALEAKIAELEKEAAEREDKYIRLAAEYDNFRRRSREEREGVYNSALSEVIAEILPIIDNLERAATFDDCDKVRDGLVMISSSASGVLAKLGVEAFGAPGEKFDPNIHNAIMHDEDDSGREEEITDVFQKGYKRGNKIIRFAMVKTVN